MMSHNECDRNAFREEALQKSTIPMKVYVIGDVSNHLEINALEYKLTLLCTDTFIWREESVEHKTDSTAQEFISHCFNEINEADFILCIPNPDGTISPHTNYEIEYARRIGKPVLNYNRELPSIKYDPGHRPALNNDKMVIMNLKQTERESFKAKNQKSDTDD